MATHVVSREAESEAVAEFLAAVPSGPAALVVEGEAGIGKTTVWLAALERAEERGFRVLSTRATSAESVLAYSALAALLDGLDDDVFAELAPPQRIAMDRVLLRVSDDHERQDFYIQDHCPDCGRRRGGWLYGTRVGGPSFGGNVRPTHRAQDCPQPFSQNCAPRQGMTAYTNGPLFVSFTADPNPPSCAPGRARIFIDGKEWGSAVVQPGQNDGGYYMDVAPGSHLVEVQMDGVLGGCNTGSMSGWSGTLHVETYDDALNGATP